MLLVGQQEDMLSPPLEFQVVQVRVQMAAVGGKKRRRLKAPRLGPASSVTFTASTRLRFSNPSTGSVICSASRKAFFGGLYLWHSPAARDRPARPSQVGAAAAQKGRTGTQRVLWRCSGRARERLRLWSRVSASVEWWHPCAVPGMSRRAHFVTTQQGSPALTPFVQGASDGATSCTGGPKVGRVSPSGMTSAWMAPDPRCRSRCTTALSQ